MKPKASDRRLTTLAIKDVRHLCYLLGTNPRELASICNAIQDDPHSYYKFRTLEKNGKVRNLATPTGRLRAIADRLNSFLQRFDFPGNMHGGIRQRSTRSYALPHVKKDVVLKSDVRDFYPSVPHCRVYNLFVGRLGCKPDVARYLTRLTTVNGQLPQGSPTSTVVANLVSMSMAVRLANLACTAGGQAGTFVDDIVISGPNHMARYKGTVRKIILQEGFIPNDTKSKIVERKNEQVIAGIRVNHGLDASSEKIKEVRDLISQLQSSNVNGVGFDTRTIRSLEGKIRYVGSFNRGAAKSLSKRLSRIQLLSSQGC